MLSSVYIFKFLISQKSYFRAEAERVKNEARGFGFCLLTEPRAGRVKKAARKVGCGGAYINKYARKTKNPRATLGTGVLKKHGSTLNFHSYAR